jgi:biopolymer transport protein ExbB/TolQ
MFHGLIEFFREGGPTMLVTLSAGFVGVAVAYERIMKLYKEYKADTKTYMSRIKELMIQNRFEDAIAYSSTEKGLLPPIIKAGLERSGCDEQLVRQAMESVYLEQTPKLQERLGYLSLIANAGLLFGLTGTVMGLIKQFAAVASADAGQKQLLMAKGIAEAMNNTALGLMVALPCLIIHGILSARATKMTEDLERSSAQFLDWIGLHNYGQLQSRFSADRKTNRVNKEAAA